MTRLMYLKRNEIKDLSILMIKFHILDLLPEV